MKIDPRFQIVGANQKQTPAEYGGQTKHLLIRKKPIISILIVAVISLICFFSSYLMSNDPAYMDLVHCSESPNAEFLFGTDSMGRDIFSMIWAGGRISLFIGVIATAISTGVAIIYGSISGMAGKKTDAAMMRFIELLLSIPSILIIIFVQAIIGQSNALSIGFVIGITGWMNISKVVRNEVRQIRNSVYVVASKHMGAGFFHICFIHLIPNFIPSIMFMIVTNIGQAIGVESTLSFLGIGLPVEIISWGSILSLSENAILSNAWWVIIIPGLFLVTTLVCITNIGNYLRKENYRRHSNL